MYHFPAKVFDLLTLYTGDVQKSSKKKVYVRFYDIDQVYFRLIHFNNGLSHQCKAATFYCLLAAFSNNTSSFHSSQLVENMAAQSSFSLLLFKRWISWLMARRCVYFVQCIVSGRHFFRPKPPTSSPKCTCVGYHFLCF